MEHSGIIRNQSLYTTLSLNVQKTKLMIFHRKQKHIQNLNISINGINIERVESFNFLGIILQETLSWDSHVTLVKTKISKVIGILYRLKNIFPKDTLKTLYTSLIASYLNYGLLLWGVESHKVEIMQKKAIRLVTNSSYFAHTTPLFIKLNVLKVQDMFKLKLLKLYYKLSCDLLPTYFNTYRDVLMQVPARSLRQNLIHPPFVKRVYSECSPLIQLIALINNLKADKNDTILVMIESKSHSFCRFAFSVSRLYLNSYNPECKILDCFVCKSE